MVTAIQERPFFSVLVPTYNQAPYLADALKSLLAQSFPNWEAVIVNDGSTDDTAEVLAEYAKRDKRFRVFHKENGGPASALNLGLEQATGDWICWLSSDDFFEPAKLAIHREWINAHPDCRFFFTHFREFNEATGELRDPPLWRPIPEREWQVLEMLHHTYVHGNSICVQRELWSQAGRFDTELRYGQDYDMWLRLAALAPAQFIPERTCVTRVNPLQMTHGFPEALFFDCAKAGIKFLNERSFEQLFPAADLDDPATAKRAIKHALDVAQNPYSFMFRLGPHPLLLLRLMEWAWDERLSEETAASIRRLIKNRASEASRQYQQTTLGFLWKVAGVASRLLGPGNREKSAASLGAQTLSPATVAEAEYRRLAAAQDDGAKAVRKYLERLEGKTLPPPSGLQSRGEVLLICHSDTDRMESAAKRQLIEGAKSLMRSGRDVAFISVGEAGIGIMDGVLALGAPDSDSLTRALRSAGALDTIIEAPRLQVLGAIAARRALLYQPSGELGEAASISAAPGSPAASVGIMLSDSADWSAAIESFTPARDSNQQVSSELRRRVDQVKRKVRRIARR